MKPTAHSLSSPLPHSRGQIKDSSIQSNNSKEGREPLTPKEQKKGPQAPPHGPGWRTSAALGHGETHPAALTEHRREMQLALRLCLLRYHQGSCAYSDGISYLKGEAELRREIGGSVQTCRALSRQKPRCLPAVLPDITRHHFLT